VQHDPDTARPRKAAETGAHQAGESETAAHQAGESETPELDAGARETAAREVVDAFHRLYYDAPERTWQDTWFLGVATQKCPLDLWVYQEIVHRLRPELIVETGTAHGGSALYLATLCDLVGRGEVVSVDVLDLPGRPAHPRIRYIHGSSTDPAVVEEVRAAAEGKSPVMVVLDSDHSYAHVRGEIEAYAGLVTPGSYLVVEDTNVNGHPVALDFGPGPYEAVEELLARGEGFVVDESCEKFHMTFNPRGYLRRLG
jgi:cephalosporin hydroxylase